MPISQKSLEYLAKLAKLDKALIEAAIKATTDTDLAIPENLHVFTPEELTARDENNQTIGISAKKEEFIQAGKEIATKEIKTKFGISDATKDLNVVLTKVQEKISADDAAKAQIELLVSDKNKLQNKLAKVEKQLSDKEVSVSRIGKLPKNINTDALTLDEHLSLINSKMEFTPEGVKLDGQILRNDKDRSPMNEQEAIEHFYSLRPALLRDTKQEGNGTKKGGRGGNDDTPPANGTYANLKEWRVAWEARNPGKNALSMDANKELREYVKEHPDLEMIDEGD